MTAINPRHLFGLHFLASSFLPSGTFAWSQGLEAAAAAGAVADGESLWAYLTDYVSGALCSFDLPLLLRFQEAVNDRDSQKLDYYNQMALAGRETQELYAAETEMGRALGRLIKSLGTPDFCPANDLGFLASYAVLASLVCHDLSFPELAGAFMYSFLENQLAAASRLIPLGQTQGRQIMLKLSGLTIKAVSLAETIGDDEIGTKLLGLTIFSCQHQRQFSRLFRS
jgi:urease accessory protein